MSGTGDRVLERPLAYIERKGQANGTQVSQMLHLSAGDAKAAAMRFEREAKNKIRELVTGEEVYPFCGKGDGVSTWSTSSTPVCPTPMKTVVSLIDSPGVVACPVEIPWKGHPVCVTTTFPTRRGTHPFHWDSGVFIPGHLPCRGIADLPPWGMACLCRGLL